MTPCYIEFTISTILLHIQALKSTILLQGLLLNSNVVSEKKYCDRLTFFIYPIHLSSQVKKPILFLVVLRLCNFHIYV